MEISNCLPRDLNEILSLYDAARNLQTLKKMVVWPAFERSFLEKEIGESRQWKIVSRGVIACNWAITFSDREIWGAKDRNDAIYIHRICNNPAFRGQRFIDAIVEWSRTYALQIGKQFIRLDTLGNNTTLIKHYTSAGFEFLGMDKLTDTATLPKHYQDEPNCCRFEMRARSG